MPLPFRRMLAMVAGDELPTWRFVDDATKGQMVRKYYDHKALLRCIEYPETGQWELYHYHAGTGHFIAWEDAYSNWSQIHRDSMGEIIGFASNGDWWRLTDPDNQVYYCEEKQLYNCPRSGFVGTFNELLIFLGLNNVVDQLSACTGLADDPVVLTSEERTIGKKWWKAFFHVRDKLRHLLSHA